MQSKADIEDWYSKPDPWAYESTEDDQLRKEIILEALSPFGRFKRALDIGSGEGWITKDLPADKIYAIEFSDNAAARLPRNITRLTKPNGSYDLIICTGMLYKHYDYQLFHKWIIRHTAVGGIVLTCSIGEWEVNNLPREKQIHTQEFPYRQYRQLLRVFKWSA